MAKFVLIENCPLFCCSSPSLLTIGWVKYQEHSGSFNILGIES